MLHGQGGVFGGEDALEQHRQPGDALEPGHGLPGEGLVEVGRDVRRQAGRAGFGLGHLVAAVRDEIGGVQMRGQAEAVPDVALAPPYARQVHRQHERAIARRLGAAYQLLRDRAILIDIELEPKRTGCDGRGLFERARRHRADDHQRLCRARRAGRRALALRRGEALIAHWGDEDWYADRCAEHGSREIAVADVHQHARAQLNVREGRAIGVQGDLVITAAAHVIPSLMVQPAFRQTLVLTHIERQHGRFLSRWTPHAQAAGIGDGGQVSLGAARPVWLHSTPCLIRLSPPHVPAHSAKTTLPPLGWYVGRGMAKVLSS